ncbi:MAG: phage portal protein [Desulfovibrionaceae bacterium]|nr:phage portal protein [Desulfovibrionaceae bacterium]
MKNTDKNILAELGITVDDTHIARAAEWRGWFDCTAARFQESMVMYAKEDGLTSVVKEGVKQYAREKALYKAHLQACTKWAALFFNEYTRIVVDEEEKTALQPELDYLEEYYVNAGIWPMLEANFAEIFGMGTMAVVTEYDARRGIAHKWFPVESILPIETSQGRIKSAVFVSTFKQEKDEYRLYNIHEELLEKAIVAGGAAGVLEHPTGASAGYRIRNIITLEKGDGKQTITPEQFGLMAEYEMPVRMFSVFKPFNRQIGNFNNALGIPIYFDHLDKITEIDDIYDVKMIDTQTSRRNIFINKDYLTYRNGRAMIPQHLFGVIVSTAGLEGFGGKHMADPISEFAPTPHSEIYTKDLQEALNRFSDAVGLGVGTFRYGASGGGGGPTTATQIVSENQEKYSNLKKHTGYMESEFIAFNQAILATANEHEAKSFNLEARIRYFIQDAVILDDETRREQAVGEVREGLRSKESYLEEFRGLSDEDLALELERIQKDGSDMDMDSIMANLDNYARTQTEGGGEDGEPDEAA